MKRGFKGDSICSMEMEMFYLTMHSTHFIYFDQRVMCMCINEVCIIMKD